MKRTRLLILATALVLGTACTSASADDPVTKEAFEQDIKPHLSHGCRSWWALMTALDSPTDNSRTVGVLAKSVLNDFTQLAVADPRSQFLADAAIVFEGAAYHTADQNRAAYSTINTFCDGFRN